MELRMMNSIASDFKTRAEGEAKYIEGYFSVFNQPYELWDDAYEIIDSDAFNDIEGADVRALINHDTTLVMGRTSANTLSLKTDSYGLWGSVLINENDQDAMNAYARVQRGDVNQCSFGFEITEQEVKFENDKTIFVIKGVKLHEISICTFPAYEATHVQARKDELNKLNEERLSAWKKAALERISKC